MVSEGDHRGPNVIDKAQEKHVSTLHLELPEKSENNMQKQTSPDPPVKVQ